MISDVLFRNILQNFGFHNMNVREIELELQKTEPQVLSYNYFDFSYCKQVVAYRWVKGTKEPGREEEARQCFKLFDKRDRNVITASDIKTVLGSYLEF